MKKLIIILMMLLPSLQGISQQKNVLFILVDDLKPLIGAYGDPFAKTPNIDRLAARGFVFENAYTSQAVCAPSRASMLTGLRPDRTKVWDLKTLIRDMNLDVVTLPQLFRENGYRTYATGKVFDPRSVDKKHDARSWTVPYTTPTALPGYEPKPKLGSYQSKEHIDKIKFYEAIAASRGIEGGKRNAFVRKNFKPSTESADVPDDAYLDGMIVNDAIEKLDRLAKGKEPFMLMVGFKKPHLPFVAPTKYWDMYDRSKVPLAKFQNHSRGGPELAYHNSPELRPYTDIPEEFNEYNRLTNEKQRELVHGYYAATSYVDAQIGKLLDELEKRGLDENTIIVLWGDHGLHLGDHGLWTKHTNFEQATRLPLIISAPGTDPGRTNIPVESVDIFPTVCRLAGVEPAEGIQGNSLVTFLKGGEPEKKWAVSQWRPWQGKGGMGYSIRTERYRYTEWYKSYRSTSPRNPDNLLAVEFYDYENDPLESRNLAGNRKYAAALEEHRKLLHKFLDSQVITATEITIPAGYDPDSEIPGKPFGTPLRELVKDNFKPGTVFIGATIDYQSLDGPKGKLLAEQFSYTTPENAVKQSKVHPRPGIWDWNMIDKIISFAKKNDIVVRLHGPVSPQSSEWAKNDNRTPEELLDNMTEYMTEQCKRFSGNKTVQWMDVVNETVNETGEWFGPKPGTDQWENPWLAIGLNDDGIPVYIDKAFEIATKYAGPHVKLIYNQHLAMQPRAWEKIKSTVLYLRKKGYRVDGIGWQAHLKDDDNVALDPAAMKYLGELINWAHANGMEFHVTEITYKVSGDFDDRAKEKQALAFSNILKVLLSRRNSGVVAYNTWGLQDGKGKWNNGHRFVFDEQLRAKPAFYAIQRVLENPNDTEPVFTADNQGKELLNNGGFENELEGWVKWGSCTVAGKGEQHSGKNCIAMGPKSGIKQSLKEIEPGKSYVVTGWVRCSEGDRITIKIQMTGNEKPVVKNYSETEYTKVEISFTPENPGSVNIIIQKWNDDPRTVFADDFSITELQ